MRAKILGLLEQPNFTVQIEIQRARTGVLLKRESLSKIDRLNTNSKQWLN
jgi:hypothetical protein